MARSSETTPVVPPIFGFVIAIAILYFARDLLIPFVFALFFAFLLTPLVKRLESWRVPRVPAALLVLCLATSALAVVGWIVADQLIDVLRGQPTYIENIQRKLEGLQGRSRGLNDIVSSLQDLGQELSARRSGIAPRN